MQPTHNPYAAPLNAAPNQPFGADGGGDNGDPRPWTPTEIISLAWTRTMGSFGVVLATQLVIGIALVIPSMIPGILVARRVWVQHGLEISIYAVVLQLVVLVVSAYTSAGVSAIYLRIARQLPATFGTLFSGGPIFGRMLQLHLLLASAGIVKAVLDLVAALVESPQMRTFGWIAMGALYIPTLFFALRWAFAAFLIIDKDRSLGAALNESTRLTAGHRGTIFLYFIIAAFMVCLSACLCIVPVLITSPMMYVGLALIYLRVTGQSEGGPEDAGPSGYGPGPGGHNGYVLPGAPSGGYDAPPGGGYGAPPGT